MSFLLPDAVRLPACFPMGFGFPPVLSERLLFEDLGHGLTIGGVMSQYTFFQRATFRWWKMREVIRGSDTDPLKK